MAATSLDLSQIKTDALNSASTFRDLVGLGAGDSATFSQAIITGGTVTASTPVINATQTWNDAAVTFTGMKLDVTDTASASDSLLMDLQVGGTSYYEIFKNGDIRRRNLLGTLREYWGQSGLDYFGYYGYNPQPSYWLKFNGMYANFCTRKNFTEQYFNFSHDVQVGWVSLDAETTLYADLRLLRDAAGTLAQRNGTNAQEYRLYNTYTDASNYERGFLKWDANTFKIGTEAAGTGTDRAVNFISATKQFTFETTGTWSKNVGLGGDSQGNYLYLHSSGLKLYWNNLYNYTGAIFGPGANHTFMFMPEVLGAAASRDWDHGINSNPTVFVQSATDPNTDNTQWIAFEHNQTDALIYAGSGGISFRTAAAGSATTSGTSEVVRFDTEGMTHTPTWNDAAVTFTGMKLDVTDTASASGSLLMDLQVGGASKFNIDKKGRIVFNPDGIQFRIGQYNSDNIGFYSGVASQNQLFLIDHAGVGLTSNNWFGWSATISLSNDPDTKLYRDAAGTLAQRNGTNAQEFRLYNTYTDASNYERGFVKWDANVFKIGTEAAGTGSIRPVHINSTSLSIGDNYSVKAFMFYNNALQLRGIGELTWGTSNDAGSTSYSIKLIRDFDLQGVLAQQSGTQPQTYRIYNTKVGTNYERAFLQWDSNVFKIGTEAAGTGSSRSLRVLGDMFGNSTTASFLTGLDLTGTNNVTIRVGGSRLFGVNGSIGTLFYNGFGIGFAANSQSTSFTTSLYEDAADTLAQRNGTNAQEFRIYNTYTDASNYARLNIETDASPAFGSSGSSYRLYVDSAGTGSNKKDIILSTPAGGAGGIAFACGAFPTYGFVRMGAGGGNTQHSVGNSHSALTTTVSGYAMYIQANSRTAGSGGQPSVYILGGDHHSATEKGGDIILRAGDVTTTPTTGRHGQILLDELDVSDPSLDGAVWNNGQVLSLSSGGSALTSSNPFTITQTWNDAAVTFTAMKMDVTDTASASDSLLMDLQVGGASKFNVNNVGNVTIPDNQEIKSSSGYARHVFLFNSHQLHSGGRWLSYAGTELAVNGGGDQTVFAYGFRIGTQTQLANSSVIYGEETNTIAQRNGTNAQEYRLYNTYTDASNYERGFLKWDANVFKIGTEAAGTGTARNLQLSATNLQLSWGSYSISTHLSGYVNFGASSFDVDLNNGIYVFNSRYIGFAVPGAVDVRLYRDAADILAQRRGANAQEFRLYNTYTDASNYERGFVKWDSNVLKFGGESAGSGSSTRTVQLTGDRRVYLGSPDTGNGIDILDYPDNTAMIFAQGGNQLICLRPASFKPQNQAGHQVDLGEVNYNDRWRTAYLGGTTVTSATPMLDLAQTWNNSAVTFTAMKMDVTDTASASGSLLMDLQVGGASEFTVKKGSANPGYRNWVLGSAVSSGSSSFLSLAQGSAVIAGFRDGIHAVSSNTYWRASLTTSGELKLRNTGLVSWTNGSSTQDTQDLFLYRDDANILAQRNGTNAQAYNIYNTYTDASNYERGFVKWDSLGFEIGTESAGTGAAKNIAIMRNGTQIATFASSGLIMGNGVGGPRLGLSGVSATTPTLLPNSQDSNSGIGQNADDQLSLIAGGLEGLRLTETAGVITADIYGDTTINGTFSATTKSFLIDHPSKPGMKLRHGSLEGPENGVYVRGTTNYEKIILPDYWKDLIDEETITVTLTPLHEFQPLFVKNKNCCEIEVGGCSGEYDYVVYGERKDVAKLEVEHWA